MQNSQNRQDGRYTQIGLSALTLLFGMQTIRTLLPLLVFVLRDRIGWNAIQVGLLALAIFLSSFLASAWRRWFGGRTLLRVTLGGLGLLRLAYQLWQGDPLVDFYLASAATVLFILVIPAYLGHIRSGGPEETGLLGLGLLLGLVLDTAWHGLYATYDMSWHNDWGTAVIILFLVLVQWQLLGQALTIRSDTRSTANDTSFRLAFVLLAIGPFLFLQLVVFQNIARLTALTGWAGPLVFAWVLAAQLVGLGTAVFLYASRHARPRLAAAVLGLFLFGSLLVGWPQGWPAAIFLLVGHAGSAGLLMLVLMGLGAGNGYAGLSRITIAHGLSAVLMVLFSFLFYASYDLPLPFPNTILPPIAALVVGLAGLEAGRRLAGVETAVAPPWRLAVTLALLLLPLYQFLTAPPVTAVPGGGDPARVMTYNLHNGFDPTGHLGIEAIAQVIENQNPDIVALQEISRGWVVNGSLDMLDWLSRRLEMPYIYGPTADPLWGNAILSRYPIIQSELVALPPDGLALRRGFIWARIDLGDGQNLDVIATHYHHPADGSPIRVVQSQAVLDYWEGDGRTILMGDLNAEPAAPEMELLRQAGLADALDLGGIQPGYTYPAAGPGKRIDYIWLSSDLIADQVIIPSDAASDHLGIAATVGE